MSFSGPNGRRGGGGGGLAVAVFWFEDLVTLLWRSVVVAWLGQVKLITLSPFRLTLSAVDYLFARRPPATHWSSEPQFVRRGGSG